MFPSIGRVQVETKFDEALPNRFARAAEVYLTKGESTYM